jgi:hypothetical protein
MSSDSESVFDPEAFMRRVEEMLLTDEITEDRKIEILRQLLAIAEEN